LRYSAGYPPSDSQIAGFFDRKDLNIHDEFVIRFLCFFEVLFEKALEKVGKMPGADPEEFAKAWRNKMQDRSDFYQAVVGSTNAKVY